MRFSLGHLEAFVTVVDAGSFSAAARKLGKVQSQISTAIGHLEDDLGVQLFDRSGKYPKLTEPGEALLYKSRDLLRSSDLLVEFADRLVLGEQTVLRIALDELVPTGVTARALSQFGKTWPNIELEVFWGAIGDVQKSVHSGLADVGVDLPVHDIAQSGFSFRQLARADFCGVAAADHPLAAMRDIDRESLRRHRQALGMSQRGTRLPDAFRVGDDVWQFEDSRLVRKLVLTGEIWAVMPRYLVAGDIASGNLVELPVRLKENEVDSTFFYIWNAAHYLTPPEQWLADAFGGQLRKVCHRDES